MNKEKLLILSFVTFMAGSVMGQVEDLTPREVAYRDSIASLNEQNASIAQSQENYNSGIQLFNKKDYKGAIESFKKSIASDANFTAAYYNKGVAENEIEKFADAELTFNKLITLSPLHRLVAYDATQLQHLLQTG